MTLSPIASGSENVQPTAWFAALAGVGAVLTVSLGRGRRWATRGTVGRDGDRQGGWQAAGPLRAVGLAALHRFSASRRASAERAATIELISAVAAELRTGAPAPLALQRGADSTPLQVCKHGVTAARYGGDIPAALRRDAAERRIDALAALAALWQVAQSSGAGMARAADRLARAESAAEEVRRELTVQLAGPRASARVLAGLPVFGLLLGNGLGASPLGWLTGSPIGIVVLCAGIGLEVLGLLWVRRLIRSVESLL